MRGTLRFLATAIVTAALPIGLIGVVGVSAASADTVNTAGTAGTAASRVSCGATLSGNTTLTADLRCHSGNGLTLGPGVRLNLNGHSLIGNPAGGAVIMSAQGGNVITNGRISNWGTGFYQDSSDNDFGPPTQDSAIDQVRFTDASGVVQFGATVAIRNSSLVDSEIAALDATVTVAASSLTRSSLGASQSDISVIGSTITGSGVSANDGGGVSVISTMMDGTGFGGAPGFCYQSGISISKSTVKNFAQPIGGSGCVVVLADSGFADNPGGVLKSQFLEGIGGGASISRSTFTASGIAIQGDNEVTVTGSKFSGNTTGVLIAGGTTDSVLSGNVFLGNSSSGVRSAATGLTLSKNRATNNGGYGIYAPQAIDQGGNTASGNKRGNCVGLTCRAS